MLRLLSIVAIVAICGCGPRSGGDSPAVPARKAALVVVAPDAAALDRTIGVLAPLGGEHLAVIRFATPGDGGGVWPTASFADRGLSTDAPVGAAITSDGVIVRWAGVGEAGRLRAAFDAVPGAARWRADRAELWRFGEAGIAVIAGPRAAIVSGGAASRRDRVALELASGALEVGAEPAADGLRLEIDGELLIATFTPEPGPIMAALGADLGRIRIGLSAAPDRVVIDVEVRPAPGTFAEHVVAGAHGPGMITPSGLFAVSTQVTPEEAVALLTELGARAQVDVAALIQSTRHGPAAITGELSLAPGAIAVRFAEGSTMRLVASLIPHLVDSQSEAERTFVIGTTSANRKGGLGVDPQAFANRPTPAPDPPAIPLLEDENTDVPWSLDYRDARNAFELAVTARSAAIAARDHAAYVFLIKWDRVIGNSLSIPLVGGPDGYRGRGEWRPRRGTIAETVERASANFGTVTARARDITRTHDAALAARQHALEIRARDVSEWDRSHRP